MPCHASPLLRRTAPQVAGQRSSGLIAFAADAELVLSAVPAPTIYSVFFSLSFFGLCPSITACAALCHAASLFWYA